MILTETVVKSAITMQHSSGQISTIYGDRPAISYNSFIHSFLFILENHLLF